MLKKGFKDTEYAGCIQLIQRAVTNSNELLGSLEEAPIQVSNY
jgi:hypothetical protein